MGVIQKGLIQRISSSGGGGVSSVDVSGGSTGLTTSGGPVTSSGTITLAGTLDVDNGGTGQTSYTNGQLLIGNTSGNTLTKATLTAGSGITITNGAGSITIAASGGGSGDVVGPASSTDNAVARFDLATGKLLQNSGVIIDDSNNISGISTLSSGNQTITGTVAITANAAAAFAVGQNGATNPAFRVVTNAFTPAVNGIELVARPAGSGVIFNVISSFATEALTFNSKGAADITFNAGNTNNFQVSGVTRGSISATNYTFSGLTGNGTATPKFNYAAPSGDASITASTNAPNVRFNMNQQRVHSTGALTLQTDFLIDASEHRFNGASALTDMAAFAINGAPVAGTNNTTTNTSTIYSAGQNVVNGTGACTNSYGLNITANAGATNNYAARLAGTAGEIFRVRTDGQIALLATNTGAGTTGNQTIDKPSGTVNFAAAATSLTVTNALCTTSSIVFATIRTNDTTAVIKNVVPGSGSFVINLNAAATAETSVGFLIIN